MCVCVFSGLKELGDGGFGIFILFSLLIWIFIHNISYKSNQRAFWLFTLLFLTFSRSNPSHVSTWLGTSCLLLTSNLIVKTKKALTYRI